MKKILKQVAGIDVAQDELVVSLGTIDEDLSAEVQATKSFANHTSGFEGMQAWIKKIAVGDLDVHYVMEATGVYHEKLAYYLSDQGCMLSVVLPNKISNYLRTLQIKTITDKTASQGITLFGLQRKLDEWKRPDPLYKKLRQLTREREQLVEERTTIKNQLHAETAEVYPGEATIKRMKKRIALLDKQEKEIKVQIEELVKQEQQVRDMIKKICSIPGVGSLTAVSVLAETNGFELIRSRRQLTSYAGLDVKEKQSGTSVKGKSRISKKGNKYLRKAMHMPALTAIRHDQRFKSVFARIVSRHGIKMKAVVAVQRKLLEIIYTVYKNNTTYDPQYLNKKIESN